MVKIQSLNKIPARPHPSQSLHTLPPCEQGRASRTVDAKRTLSTSSTSAVIPRQNIPSPRANTTPSSDSVTTTTTRTFHTTVRVESIPTEIQHVHSRSQNRRNTETKSHFTRTSETKTSTDQSSEKQTSNPQKPRISSLAEQAHANATGVETSKGPPRTRGPKSRPDTPAKAGPLPTAQPNTDSAPPSPVANSPPSPNASAKSPKTLLTSPTLPSNSLEVAHSSPSQPIETSLTFAQTSSLTPAHQPTNTSPNKPPLNATTTPTTSSNPSPTPLPPNSITGIALGATATTLIFVALLAFFFYRRRQRAARLANANRPPRLAVPQMGSAFRLTVDDLLAAHYQQQNQQQQQHPPAPPNSAAASSPLPRSGMEMQERERGGRSTIALVPPPAYPGIGVALTTEGSEASYGSSVYSGEEEAARKRRWSVDSQGQRRKSDPFDLEDVGL